MENYTHYLYLINVDDSIVKFGISSHICNRLYTHHNKFICKLNLKSKLDIMKIFSFKNKCINEEVEKRLKKCILLNGNRIKKYGETEVFYIKDIEIYKKKICNFINNLADEFDMSGSIISNINDNFVDTEPYVELSKEEISEIYNTILLNKKLHNNIPLCPRCGLIFDNIGELISHLNNNDICETKYIDATKDDLINNYNIYYNDFILAYRYKYNEIEISSKKDNTTIPIINNLKIIKTHDCFRCGSMFSSKGNLNKHLRKSVECEPIYLDISREIIIDKYDGLFEFYNESRNRIEKYMIEMRKRSTETKIIENGDGKFLCSICKTAFTNKSNVYRHRKKTCNKTNYQPLLETERNAIKTLVELFLTKDVQVNQEKLLKEQQLIMEEQELKMKEMELKLIELSNKLN